MKWLERRTTDANDLETKQIERKFGLSGCTIWDRLQLLVAENMTNDNIDDWGYVAKEETIQSMAEKIRCTVEEFKSFVKFCDESLILEKKNGRLFCQYVLDRMNEYARRALKNQTAKGEKNGKSVKTGKPKKTSKDTEQTPHKHHTTPHSTKTSTNVEGGQSPPAVVVGVSYGNHDINEGMAKLEHKTKEKLNRFALQRLYTKYSKERVLRGWDFSQKHKNERYCPQVYNYLDLEEKWKPLEDFARRAVADKSASKSKSAFFQEGAT